VSQQIQLQRLREREVDDRIEISDAEIDQFLAEAKSDGGKRSEYNLAHILVRLPDQASPEQIDSARSKAEKARAEAAAGTDFAKIAASYSDAPDALQGGSMGWRPEDRLPEIFAGAVKAMKKGDVSGVLRSPGGFHVIKLVDRRGAEEGAPVEQTRARHILVRTSEVVSENDARRRLADLRERIVTGGADFAELARQHSADGSASRGGDLDWLLPGDTVPEFERVMNALKTGEIQFRLTPRQGEPTDVTVSIRSGRAENNVAKDVRDAFAAKLSPERYTVEVDDGEDILIKKKEGQPDFSLELVDSDVQNVSIKIEGE